MSAFILYLRVLWVFFNLLLLLGASKWDIRQKVWDYIEEKNLANFPRPVHHRIPNFKAGWTQFLKLWEGFSSTNGGPVHACHVGKVFIFRNTKNKLEQMFIKFCQERSFFFFILSCANWPNMTFLFCEDFICQRLN